MTTPHPHAVADDHGTDFAAALTASGPAPGLSDLYAPLIGAWDVTVRDLDRPDGPTTTEGEWLFSWTLEGRAVQDVFIVPRRPERGVAVAVGNRYGTTLRTYRPASADWRVLWVNPVTGAENRLTGRREGNEIVQTGTGEDGRLMRWVFSDLTPTSFRWRGEGSTDGGVTWHLEAEFLGRRR